MPEPIQVFLDQLADAYAEHHRQREDLVWRTSMGLTQDFAALQRAEQALRGFISDAETLERLQAYGAETPSLAQREVLGGWVELFRRNVVADPSARTLVNEIIMMESDVEQQRTSYRLSYVDPESGMSQPTTIPALASRMRGDPDSRVREAAWLGLRGLETFLVERGFVEIVVARNRLARKLGYCDFYDYKVQQSEGFDKRRLFELLDELTLKTDDAMRASVSALTRDHRGMVRPWDWEHFSTGSMLQDLEPYFPFDEALGRWGRTFYGMGVRYRGARIQFDLVERAGKYSNAFMLTTAPPFVRQGRWCPAEINVTSNALPDLGGAGYDALRCLFHEAGHAAHFANIVAVAPCFSQEYAPSSMAFSETQAVFFESLVRDPEWLARYATHRDTERPVPFELVRAGIEREQPAAAYHLRRVLAVCYFERALYELNDSEVTAERILEVARDCENRLLFVEGGASFPTLAIPHLLRSDAACSCHAYALAELAAAQMRRYFLGKYGRIVDEPGVGAELRDVWKPGNQVGFAEAIRRLTGTPVDADALVDRITAQPERLVEEAAQALAGTAHVRRGDDVVDLEAELSIAHGQESIAGPSVSFAEVTHAFRHWIRRTWPIQGTTQALIG